MIVTNIKKAIPDSVEQYWHEFRASFKKAEEETTGDDTISEGVEMAGWGVEEATEENNKNASTFSPYNRIITNILLTLEKRYGNETRARLRNPQILHLHPGAPNSSNHTESGPDAARLGLGHRKTYDERSESFEESELAA